VLAEFVTHYARGAPFRSVTAARAEGWPSAVASLTPDNAWGLDRYADPHYLPRRLAVEARLRAALLAAGGAPRLEQPFYGFLGSHPGWEALRSTGMRAWRVPLTSIPQGCLSFTWGDSLVTLDPDYREIWRAAGHEYGPWAGRVYPLEALPALRERVAAEGGPADPDGFRLGLEVQLWWRPPTTSGE
jgi:hypothetical protein